MKKQLVMGCFLPGIDDLQGEMNRLLGREPCGAGEFASQIFLWCKVSTDYGFALIVRKCQFNQRKRLAEAGPVVDDGVYRQLVLVAADASYCQVTDLDLADISRVREFAVQEIADCCKDGAPVILTRQGVETGKQQQGNESYTDSEYQAAPE